MSAAAVIGRTSPGLVSFCTKFRVIFRVCAHQVSEASLKQWGCLHYDDHLCYTTVAIKHSRSLWNDSNNKQDVRLQIPHARSDTRYYHSQAIPFTSMAATATTQNKTHHHQSRTCWYRARPSHLCQNYAALACSRDVSRGTGCPRLQVIFTYTILLFRRVI